jgi:hypothetical protein
MSADRAFPTVRHEADLCIVGGGVAGLCAALAAARHGARVVLMQDRPVLGGNTSRECRVHVTGADRSNNIPHLRETGILEELRLENLRRNRTRSHALWDTVFYDLLRREEKVTLLLNCSCLQAETEGDRILSVTGWQTSSQRYRTVEARLFADCSGDGVLAPLTGAACRRGREARSEFGESIAPEQADHRTMGMTCLFMARDTGEPVAYTPPPWARRFASCDDFPYGSGHHQMWRQGYWWIELGNEDDEIHETEEIRDRVLAVTYGVWDHIKNSGAHPESETWALEWVEMLPAKRESRRFEGDHILTQHDIEAEGRFEDLVAYGGWTMDDHHWAGFRCVELGEPATQFHPAPSPYGIPYRCLYSRNVENLFFAGRNASCTHAAMSSTRVMGTGASMGQALGTAAALAAEKGLSPRQVGDHIGELQRRLQEDDAYLPWHPRAVAGLTREATLSASQGDPEPVRDGTDRQVDDDPHCWVARPGDWLALTFDGPRHVREARLVLDSAMDQLIQLTWFHGRMPMNAPPAPLPRRLRLEGRTGETWETVARLEENHQRLVRLPVERELCALRLVLEETWGAEESRVYAIDAR